MPVVGAEDVGGDGDFSIRIAVMVEVEAPERETADPSGMGVMALLLLFSRSLLSASMLPPEAALDGSKRDERVLIFALLKLSLCCC